MSGRPTALLPQLLATCLFLWLTPSGAEAQPQFYETVLTLQQPVVNVSSVERVVYRWSTFQPSGLITELDLEDLTMELWAPDGLIYRDRMIFNGVVQPFAEFPRELGADFDVFWRMNLNSGTLEQMSNINVTNIEASTGLHYDVHDSISIPDDGQVSIKAYLDGINQDPHTDQLGAQETTPMIFFGDFETGTLEDWSSSSP